MTGRKSALMAAAVLGLAPTATASLMTLTLSTHSSDGANAPPPEVLDATVDFEVVGTTLTIEITNDTLAPDGYNINQFYFNGPAGVTLTVDTLPNQWTFDGSGAINVNGFGDFDFSITNGQGETHPSVIDPGETATFIFTISGGTPDVKDFTTAMSELDGGNMTALIAAKFVSGPNNDDSAFGATVPTPGVLALMGVAAVVVARPKRRRD